MCVHVKKTNLFPCKTEPSKSHVHAMDATILNSAFPAEMALLAAVVACRRALGRAVSSTMSGITT